jgi:hypothetical protein
MESDNSGVQATKRLLTSYYEGLAKKEDWGQLLTDEFLLTGTVAKESRGREEYVGNGFFKSVQALHVKQLITEGNRGFAVVGYELKSPKGTPFTCEVAEYWIAKKGKLDSVSIYFDTAAFAKSMAQ